MDFPEDKFWSITNFDTSGKFGDLSERLWDTLVWACEGAYPYTFSPDAKARELVYQKRILWLFEQKYEFHIRFEKDMVCGDPFGNEHGFTYYQQILVIPNEKQAIHYKLVWGDNAY